MSQIDIEWVRAQFPALAQQVNGLPAVFLDGPGGTQVPQRVIDAIADYLVRANANSHGTFITSQRTDAVAAGAHAAMADLLGCGSDEVVFGPNMTTLTFALSRALGRDLRPGDEIIVTYLDHDANVAPWRALEERGVVIRVADIDVEDCTLDMNDLERQINERTRLVAVGYASNAVGTINDVASITKLARDAGALIFIDAVHYAPHGPIDVQSIDCDFLACSPYKFFGPHSGVLYGKREHLERLRPFKVRPAPEQLPFRWETGTPNYEGMAGVTAAIDYLAELGQRSAGREMGSRRNRLLGAMEAIVTYERGLAQQLIEGLQRIPGLTLYGISDRERLSRRTPTVSVRIAGQSPRSLAQALSERGIFTWNGNYYALGLTERLGVEEQGGMLRIGLVHYNTAAEVDRLLEALHNIV